MKEFSNKATATFAIGGEIFELSSNTVTAKLKQDNYYNFNNKKMHNNILTIFIVILMIRFIR